MRRDEELLGAEVLGTYVPTMIPSDFARHVIRGSKAAVAVSGVALARDGRAVVVATDAVLGWANPADGPLDLFGVAAHCMRRGWGLVALDVVPIDGSGAFASVDPFHRPFAVEADTPLAAMLGSAKLPVLVPASQFGPLVGRANIGAFVVAAPSDGEPELGSAPPSAVLARACLATSRQRRPAAHLLRPVGRARRAGPLSCAPHGDDLGAAATQLELVA